MSGADVLRQIRQRSSVPVVVLSGLDFGWERDAVLDLGADDYVTKPFRLAELLARLRRVLQRDQPERRTTAHLVLDLGGLTVDFADHLVVRGSDEILLSPREWALLSLLASRLGRTVPQRDLVEALFAGDPEKGLQNLRVVANRLRARLGEDADSPRYLVTVPGLGYRLERSAKGHEETAAEGQMVAEDGG